MIRALHLQEILELIGSHALRGLTAQLQNGGAGFTQVNTDTRTLAEGDLFVALKGERFDAHDFIQQAVDKKPCALVVERYFPEISLPQLVVSDSLLALGQIAAFNRSLFAGPVVAITGSSGKTTVKTMLASILQQAGETHATRGNFNNHIGVPLTLLQLTAEHKFAVVEMGASGPNEIAYLCELAKPDVTMINNVMPAHIEGFGSIEGVAKAKGEIYQALSLGQTAVVNLDEKFAAGWLQQLHEKSVSVIKVGLHNQSADVFASDILLDHPAPLEHPSGGGEFFGVQFQLHYKNQIVPVSMSAQGEHNVRNALMASACALALKVDLKKIQQGLQNFSPVAGRMARYQGVAGSQIIDDSYNANPGSVRAAIDVLARAEQNVLVLGDLAELGENAAELHAELGEYARQKNIQQLFTLGKLSEHLSRRYGQGAEHFTDRELLISRLQQIAKPGMTYLIKGSRSARMELVVQALCANQPSIQTKTVGGTH